MLVEGGNTNVTTYFALRLTADGKAATGLTITNIDLQYTRSGVAPTAKVDATALAATDSAHADNKAIEIDSTDQPGLYRVDWPDAAFSTGVREVILSVKVATAFTEHLRVEIDAGVDAIKVGGATPLTAANIKTEITGALEDEGLDNLSQTTPGATKPATGTYLDQIMNKSGSQTFSPATDSLEANRDNQLVGTTTLTEDYAADGAAMTLAQAMYEMVQWIEERTKVGTTVTIKKRDGSTTAMTFTLDDSIKPTSITRAT